MDSDTHSASGYRVDIHGFLERPDDWDEGFAVANAQAVGIMTGLSDDHWRVIRFIRDAYEACGKVPQGFVTCISNNLRLIDLKRLFPAGYHRGACRLAGVSYWTGLSDRRADLEPSSAPRGAAEGTYRTSSLGFLVDPGDWDEGFAIGKAVELKMEDGLTDDHWKVIRYLRQSVIDHGVLPTLYQTCEDNGIELEDLMRLFPDGYHRGAVKLAGLRFF